MFSRLHVFKKLLRSPVLTADTGDPICCGIFTLPVSFVDQSLVSDKSINFLIDSGSCLSIIPRRFSNKSRNTGSLRAANGSSIPTFGTILAKFTVPGIVGELSWSFTVADTLQPILGADFLEHFDLLIDCRNRKLVQRDNPRTFEQVKCKSSSPLSCVSVFQRSSGSTLTQMQATLVSNIPSRYPGCISKLPQSITSSVVSHSIPTSPCHPFRTRSRELAISKRQAVEKEFLDLEVNGVVRRSSSPWASAIHVVTKADGSFRPCGDYRFLNSVTIHDSYPMPLITDIMNSLSGMTIFSKIDLAKAFHQIPVAAEDIEKTAVITPFGLFEYVMMPFGLRNAAQTFQRHIDFVLKDFSFARPYLDDILVFSSDIPSHTTHIELVLGRLNRHNLLLNLKKCVFYASQVQFLGHVVSSDGRVAIA